MTQWTGLLMAAVAGAALGAAIAVLWARARIAARDAALDGERAARAAVEAQLEERERRLADAIAEIGELKAELAAAEERLAHERRIGAEKLQLLEEARQRLADTFKSLSAEALRSSNESFLQLAREQLGQFQQAAVSDLEQRHKAIEQLTRPIRERLEKVDGTLGELEKARVGAYRELSSQLRALVETHLPQLHRQTADLVKALRQPQARGNWGEVQLRRVVEMAGMVEHCDFDEQVSTLADSGARLRPDLVVHLPGGRQVVVDAKTPIEAYLEAVEAQDEAARAEALARHARQLRDHITALSRKSYFEQFDPTPEFVVLFVPGEAFFSAALAQDPGLIEYGADNRVIPASPTTLIALLKAVAYGWRQEAVARNAAEVAALGRELYERIGVLAEHWGKVGQRLDQAVAAYNRSVASLETRVLPSARRFRELRATGGDREIAPLAPITVETRALTAEELQEGGRPDRPQAGDEGSERG